MDIIVDGYNVVGSDQGMHGALEQKRDRLIQRLSIYRTMKKFGMIVVFDGWRSGWAHEAEDNEKVSMLSIRARERRPTM